MEVISVENKDKVCVLCKRGTVDEVNLGKLYETCNVVCHYYCLLFASNIPQNGARDSDGILGFLQKDILKEVRRVHSNRMRSFYKCKYCKKEGATIGCCIGRTCRELFHFPCGLENGVHYQFDSFNSYCMKHGSLPDVKKVRQNEECPICKISVKKEVASSGNGRKQTLVVGTCCKKTYYHKICIQKYALNAGLHAFKCPCCNSEDFKAEVQFQGVYLPNQDASWELEEGAFEDQLIDGKCDATKCSCQMGIYFNGDAGSAWELIRCCNCGAACTHLKCSAVKEEQILSWVCETCRSLKSHRPKRARIGN